MKAVVLEDVGKIAVRQMSEPASQGQALIQVERAGLCGTDLKIVSGHIPVRFPLVLGHEVVGRVAAQGPTGQFPTGSRVLVNPVTECGYCALCRDDRGYLCPKGALRGRDADGGFAEFMAVDEDRLHLVPESISAEEVSLLQVLGTCVHAQTLIQVFPGQCAVVVGLGVSGLLHLQLLRARGIDNVIGVTRSPWKRDLALSMGAREVAVPGEAAAVVDRLSGGQGADLVVESAGQAATLRQSLDLARAGSTVLVFGTVAGTTELPTYSWYFKELAIINARAARPRDYDRAVQLAASGSLNLAPLVSSHFSIDEAEQAIAACQSGGQLKVMLEIGQG